MLSIIKSYINQIKVHIMGTSNFARLQNATKYFTVLMDREEKFVECEECENKYFEHDESFEYAEIHKDCGFCGSKNIKFDTEFVSPDYYEVEDLNENLKEAFHTQFTKDCFDSDYSDNDRNYNSVGIVKINKSFSHADISVDIKFTVIRTSAYYEGANLDYLIQFEFDTCYGVFDWSQIEEVDKDCLHTSELNDGMKTIHLPKIVSKMKKVVEATSKEIEQILAQWSEGFVRVGGFSDGTSLYEKVS